jgi:predicted ATP-binding protein involved in virulence
MRLKNLFIKNFKSIEKMRLNLHPRLNVFVGDNGVGKTTILNAISRVLDVLIIDYVTESERRDIESGAVLTTVDIKSGKNKAEIKAQISHQKKTVSTIVSSDPKEINSDLKNHFTFIPKGINYKLFAEDRFVFSADYMPNEDIKKELTVKDPMIGFIVNHAAQFAPFYRWISEREAVENSRLRKFIDEGKDFVKDPFESDKHLQLAKKVIGDITGFTGLFDDREKGSFTIRKYAESNQEEVILFSQLSTGEKQLITLVTTIAVFLIVNYDDEKDPFKKEAVIAIDAIELHLHPSWQRMILNRLLEHFPNCQFIVTTHSPQVIGNVDPDSVFILKRVDDQIVYEKPETSLGMSVDRILELLMDEESIPNEEIRQALSQLNEQISRGNFADAQEILNDLKNIIPSDPNLIRAEVLFHKKGLEK